MESLLLPASIVGCSVSILFALSTFIVLGCYRARTRPLMIKQQLSLSLVFTYVVVLSGLQGYKNDIGCRAVAILLHYGVTSSFCWILADIYHTTVCLKRVTFTASFLKIFLCMWGLPLISGITTVILGITVNQRLNYESKLFICWKSDHIIWGLVAPCFLIIMISCYFLSTCSYSIYQRKSNPFTQKERRSMQAINYSVRTNIVMLFLTTVIWVFGCEIIWYNTEAKFQLVFGLTVGVQGLFLFFFYCVFCLEHGLYISDNILDDFSEHFVEEERAEKQIVNKKKTPIKVNKISEVKASKTKPKNDIIVSANSEKMMTTEVADLPRLVSEASGEDKVEYCSSSTKALVHKTENKPKDILVNKTEIPHNETSTEKNSLTEVVNNDSTEKERNDNIKNHISEIRNEQSVNDNIKTAGETEAKIEKQLSKGMDENERTSTDPVKSKRSQSLCQSNTHIGSEFSLSGEARIRRDSRKGSEASQISLGVTGSQSTSTKGTRSNSRASQRSFASNMGLNELESLFNNPELMMQSITKRNREKAKAEEAKKEAPSKRETFRQSRKAQSQGTINTDNQTNKTKDTAKQTNGKKIRSFSANANIAEVSETNCGAVQQDMMSKVEEESRNESVNEMSVAINEKTEKIVNKYLKKKDNG